MAVLVTGAAGFVGYHVSRALVESGTPVVGIDNLNSYYDPALKRARLAELSKLPGFRFAHADIAAPGSLAAAAGADPFETVIHLAAQVGVRSALHDPAAHVRDNLVGQFEVLEFCRARRAGHLVHASTSAVYGANPALPFAADQRVDDPVSFYGATKRGGELIARAWSNLHALPITSLRFFTVYGPWGRPDMATWKFTDAIARGTPIRVHGHGAMRRSFTEISDIVPGVVAASRRIPPADARGFRHAIYNLGNPGTVTLAHFIAVLEDAVGVKAVRQPVDAEPGEMMATHADIATARRDLGYDPRTPVELGLPRFVDWYRGYCPDLPAPPR